MREEIIKGENILSDYSDKANEASQKYLETIREKQSQLEELTLSYNDLKNRLETTTSLLNTAESKNEKLDLQAKQITEMNYLLDDMKLRLNDNAEFSKREAANVADLIQKNKNLNAQLNDSKNLNDSQQKEISTLSSRISALNNVEIELTNAKRIIEDSKQVFYFLNVSNHVIRLQFNSKKQSLVIMEPLLNYKKETKRLDWRLIA